MTRAATSPTHPRAHAICDRCGFRYNHDQLKWQMDWRGPRLQNLRILVCSDCYDAPQQSGQRTILIPPDPVPIMNARPEFYVPDNNPLGGIGADPDPARFQYGSIIGTMTQGGGPQAAFNANPAKPSWMSAVSISRSSYDNYVGVNWTGNQNSFPAALRGPVITHTVSSFTITAPVDSTFGSTAYVIQQSQTDAGWGSWTTIASGNPAGTVNETITGTCAGSRAQFHRAAFLDNGHGTAIAVANVVFNVSDGSSGSE